MIFHKKETEKIELVARPDVLVDQKEGKVLAVKRLHFGWGLQDKSLISPMCQNVLTSHMTRITCWEHLEVLCLFSLDGLGNTLWQFVQGYSEKVATFLGVFLTFFCCGKVAGMGVRPLPNWSFCSCGKVMGTAMGLEFMVFAKAFPVRICNGGGSKNKSSTTFCEKQNSCINRLS